MAFQTFCSSCIPSSVWYKSYSLLRSGAGGSQALELMEHRLQLKANISTSVTACWCFKKEKKSIKNINIKLLGFWSICFMEKVFLTELGSWEVDKDALLLKLWNRQRLSCWVVNKRSQALVGDEAEELGWRQEEKVDGLGACESQPRTKGQAEQEGNPCPVFCINLASYCSREIFYCFLFSPAHLYPPSLPS